MASVSGYSSANGATPLTGFICPNCVVTLPSAEKLQSHWLEFHAEDLPDAPGFIHVARDGTTGGPPRPSATRGAASLATTAGQHSDSTESSASSERSVASQQPQPQPPQQERHQLLKSVLSRPRACKVCHQIIWSDTMTCQLCAFHCHMKCVDKDTSLCSRTSGGLVSPVRGVSPVKRATPAENRAPQPHEPRGLVSKVRHKVSQGRSRYIDESFDLDLSYITERLIAMSFPSAGVEATYRNNLNDVARMLKLKHKENFMVFNVSERSYDVSKLNHQVLDFGWPDHLAPPLDRLCSICKSIDSWLASDTQNVAVVHCKGGKGRTGVVVAAYMHYSNQHDLSAEAALDLFAMKRFYDDRCGGVTQPSQRRLVKYFEWLLKGQISFTKSPLYLSAILIHGIPNFDGHGYCRPYVRVYQDLKVLYTSDIQTVMPGSEADFKKRVVFELTVPLVLHGDIMIRCFHKRATGHEVIFRLQFHTCAAVRDQRMVLGKADLDDAHNDRRFPDSARVELIFQPPPVEIDDPTISTALTSMSSPDSRMATRALPAEPTQQSVPTFPLARSTSSFAGKIPAKVSEDSLATTTAPFGSDVPSDASVDEMQSAIMGSLQNVDADLAAVEIARVGSFGVTGNVERPLRMPYRVKGSPALGTVNTGYESVALADRSSDPDAGASTAAGAGRMIPLATDSRVQDPVGRRASNGSKRSHKSDPRDQRHAQLAQMGSDPILKYEVHTMATPAADTTTGVAAYQDSDPRNGVSSSSGDVAHNYADVGAILAAKKMLQRPSLSPSDTVSGDGCGSGDEEEAMPMLPHRPEHFELEDDCFDVPPSSASRPSDAGTSVGVVPTSPAPKPASPKPALRQLPPLPLSSSPGSSSPLRPLPEGRSRSASCSSDYQRTRSNAAGNALSSASQQQQQQQQRNAGHYAGMMLTSSSPDASLGITPSLSLDSIVGGGSVTRKLSSSRATGSLHNDDNDDDGNFGNIVVMPPQSAPARSHQPGHGVSGGHSDDLATPEFSPVKGLLTTSNFASKVRKRRSSPSMAGSIELAAQHLKKLTAMRGNYRISLGDMISHKKSNNNSGSGSSSGSSSGSGNSNERAEKLEKQRAVVVATERDESSKPPLSDAGAGTLSRVTIPGEMRLESTVSSSDAGQPGAGSQSGSSSRDRFFQDHWIGGDSTHTATAASTRPFWFYKAVSRDEADGLLEDRPIGTFLCRESRSTKDAFSLSMRAAPEGMALIKHYLLEPSEEAGRDGRPGVHLRLTAEAAFDSLEQFVDAHISQALALPCKLILPRSDWVGEARKTTGSVTSSGSGGIGGGGIGAASSSSSNNGHRVPVSTASPSWKTKFASVNDSKGRSSGRERTASRPAANGGAGRSLRSPSNSGSGGGSMKVFGRCDSKPSEEELEYVRLDFSNVDASAVSPRKRQDTMMARIQHSGGGLSGIVAPACAGSVSQSAATGTTSHAPLTRLDRALSPVQPPLPLVKPTLPSELSGAPDIHTFSMVYLGSSSVTARNWRSAMVSSYEQVTARRHLKSIHVTMATCPSFIALTDDFGKTLSFDMGHVLHCSMDPFERRFWVSTALTASTSPSSPGATHSAPLGTRSSPPPTVVHTKSAGNASSGGGVTGMGGTTTSGHAIPPAGGGGRMQERSVLGVIVRKDGPENKKVCHLFAPHDDNYHSVIAVETIQAQMAIHESLKPVHS